MRALAKTRQIHGLLSNRCRYFFFFFFRHMFSPRVFSLAASNLLFLDGKVTTGKKVIYNY